MPGALRAGKVRLNSCDYAATPSSFQQSRAMIRQVDEARWALQVHRTSHPRASSIDFARRLAATLDLRHNPTPES
jgi:hypothetical protein